MIKIENYWIADPATLRRVMHASPLGAPGVMWSGMVMDAEPVEYVSLIDAVKADAARSLEELIRSYRLVAPWEPPRRTRPNMDHIDAMLMTGVAFGLHVVSPDSLGCGITIP